MTGKLRKAAEAVRISFLKQLGLSDLPRWRKASNLSAEWDSRNKMIASLVPERASVIEFGAGRMVLPTFLPAGCTYTPSDVVDRGQGTLVIDLNGKDLPPIPRHDVAVFSGVLEYVYDVPRLILHLSQFVDCVVASYAVADLHPRRLGRRSLGWVNDFTAQELAGIFANAGFRHDHDSLWGTQKICRFVRSDDKGKTTPA